MVATTNLAFGGGKHLQCCHLQVYKITQHVPGITFRLALRFSFFFCLNSTNQKLEIGNIFLVITFNLMWMGVLRGQNGPKGVDMAHEMVSRLIPYPGTGLP